MSDTMLNIRYLTAKTKALEDLKNRLRREWPNLFITQTHDISDTLLRPAPDLVIVESDAPGNPAQEIAANVRDTPLIVVGSQFDANAEASQNKLVSLLTPKEFGSPLLLYVIGHLLDRKSLLDKLRVVTTNLQSMTIRDDLTGLYNCRYLDNILESELKKSKRYKTSVSALLIGIDGLKVVNETYGYEIGNKIICEFAVVIQNSIRDVDTVGRLSGDEFVIVLPATNQESAVKVAERIRRDIHNTQFAGGRLANNATASIGISECRPEYRTIGDWLEALRKAMVEAKHSGKDQICTIDDTEALDHPQLLANTQLIAELHNHIAHLTEEFKNSYFKEVLSLTERLPFYKKFILPHAERVSFYAEKIATKIGMQTGEITAIRRASLLHDIGKVAIDKKVILKSGNLSANEYELLKQHPIIGIQIMGNTPFWKNELSLILHHHEWFDGRGYPDKLKSTNIPLGARIIAISEAWDTMTTDQLYRPAIPLDKALEEIKRNRSTQFDPELAQVFVSMIEG